MQRIGMIAVGACLGVTLVVAEAHAVAISVINNTDEVAYFRFGGATTPQGSFTFKSGPMQIPVTIPLNPNPNVQFQIQPHSKLTGVELTYIDAGKLLVSVGNGFTGGYQPNKGGYDAFSPQFQPNSGPDSQIRWDKAELTVHGDGFDSVNLSSTDFMGLRLSLQTLKNGNPVGNSLTWRSPDTASVFSAIGSVAHVQADAFVTGSNGLNVPGLGNVLRAIAPSTASPVAYQSQQAYLDYVMQGGISTHVKGRFFGNSHAPAATYDFTATICDGSDPACAAGSAKLVGTISTDPGKTHTIIIPPIDKDNRSLAYQLYLQDFKYTVDGGPGQDVGANDAFTAAARDYLAGFAFGLVGSTAIDPRRPGIAFKDESTDYWYSDPDLHLPTHLTVNDVFDHAAPKPGFYNAFAAEIAAISDSYGFPFTDVLGKPLLPLKPSEVDQLILTIMPDDAPHVSPFILFLSLPDGASMLAVEAPEPASALLLVPAVAALRLVRRRRPA